VLAYFLNVYLTDCLTDRLTCLFIRLFSTSDNNSTDQITTTEASVHTGCECTKVISMHMLLVSCFQVVQKQTLGEVGSRAIV